MSGPSNALNGIRIIDLSMGWAGPLACRHMADLGADVIKIESCERFDWWRSWEATPEWIADNGAEKSTAFNTVNRNKRNVTLDLNHPRGRSLLMQLVKGANAVVENYSAGVLPKLGLGYDVFREANPEIILMSMPAFGSTGPWREFRAYGSTVEHSSGLPHLNGMEADPPTMLHVAYGDACGGLNGSAALLVALRHQAKTGKGQFVDLSQTEGLFPLAAHGILEFAASGQAPVRQGNRSQQVVPQGVYPCAGEDNWIVIQAFDEQQWRALQKATDGLLDSFGDRTDRFARLNDLDDQISTWTRAQEASALMVSLQKAGVPAAATHTPEAILNDPHLNERGFWQWMDRTVVGHQPNPSPPYRTADSPITLSAPAATLGQHNREVLGQELGLSDQDLEELTDLGIIGTKPRMPAGK
jgi:crotonobetainyl-CoA:carnitine CoA-transferase CaiB-like acyl-CoA transferase